MKLSTRILSRLVRYQQVTNLTWGQLAQIRKQKQKLLLESSCPLRRIKTRTRLQQSQSHSQLQPVKTTRNLRIGQRTLHLLFQISDLHLALTKK